MTDTTPIRADRSEIYAIQLLRAIAASLVVVDHSLLALPDDAVGLAHKNLAWAAGDIGVETFFAISGCLMMMISVSEFGKPGAAIRFFKRRLIRIAPLYWLVTTVLLLMIVRRGDEFSIAQVIASYLFIPYEFRPGQTHPLLSQGWTLNYEMFFYAVFSLTLLLSVKRGIVMLFGIFGLVIFIGSMVKPLSDTNDPRTALEVWTDPIIVTFLAGCVVALLRPGMMRRSWPAVSPLCLAGLASLLLVAACVGTVLGSDTFPRPVPIAWSMRLAAVLAVLVCLVPHGPPTSRVGRWLYLLGNASYSTYLVHTFAIRYGMMVLEHTPLTNEVVIVVVLLVFGNLGGLAVHLAIEMPILRYLAPERRSRAAIGPPAPVAAASRGRP